jgi:hypothetical protein
MTKKLTSIMYRYDDGSVEYVDDVTQVSIFEFNWLSSIIRWFKKKED